jgi:hypothetical protein
MLDICCHKNKSDYIKNIIITKIIFISIFFPFSAFSDPAYSATDCIGPSTNLKDWPNKNDSHGSSPLSGYTDGDPIFYYIESDFGKEMRDCMDQNPNNTSPILGLLDADANDQIKNTIISAAEIWNLESRTAVLIYAGTINAETADQACSSYSSTKKPAIFIRFEDSCKFNGVSCDTASASTTTEELSSCDNTVEIVVWGDINTNGSCSGSGNEANSGIYEWQIDGSQNNAHLKNTMIHEFGHALGLGHPSDLGSNPVGGDTIMQGAATVNQLEDFSHLYPWDNDCSDDTQTSSHRARRRIIEYRYQGFTSTGSQYSSVISNGTDIVKGFLSGNYMRDDMDRYAGLFFDDKISTDLILTTGSVSLTNQSSFSDNDLLNPLMYFSPILMTPVEKTGDDDSHRINFNFQMDCNTGCTSFTSYDPPQTRYFRSDDFFVTEYQGSYQYSQCSNGSCTTDTGITSHIPLVSAWDDYSGNTLFVKVGTGRSYAGHGEIDVFPGFHSTTNGLKLRPPSRLSTNRSSPTDSFADFSYTLKTDVAPGVACAPDRNDFSYNCIIAWVDRGIMEGDILYTYFRIDSNAVVWSPNHDVFIRSGANSFSHISAAFFDGSFWLAWKTIDGDVKYCRTDSHETDWDANVSLSRTQTVDPPTWTYVPEDTKESLLIWTEYDEN